MSLATNIVVILNLIVVVFIVMMVIFIVSANETLKECQNNQSNYCYSIQCPSESTSTLPCRGYAQRSGPITNGNPTFYCSYAPSTLVDQNGNAIL
jgi:hypothetical protein